jgi:hypothetical protein
MMMMMMMIAQEKDVVWRGGFEGVHWIGDWVGCNANLDVLEKRNIFCLAGTERLTT